MISFSAKRFVLLDLAGRAIDVVPSSSARPVCQCFKVVVSSDLLTVSATDVDQSLVVSSPMVTYSGDAASFLVPARRLLELLREAPEGDITVDVDGKVATVRAGAGSWTLRLRDEEFPALPDLTTAKWHEYDRGALLSALKIVRHAVSRESRAALSCVSIVQAGDGSAKVSAYDGARFQQVQLAKFPLSMQIPAAGSPAAVDELVKVLSANPDIETAEVAEDKTKLLFRAGSLVFATGKHLARAADAEQSLLVPALAGNQLMTADREALRAAIRRVRVNADPDTSAIGMQLDASTVRVIAKDKAQNSAQEDVPATWEGAAGRLLVLNHRHLDDALAAHPGESAVFRLGPDMGKKRSLVLLRDDATGVSAVLPQGHPKTLGL